MEIDTKNRIDIAGNLKDAGCDQKTIDKFLSLQKQGKDEECLHCLAKHRCELLHTIHIEQKRIDILDYLIYKMKKAKKEEMKK